MAAIRLFAMRDDHRWNYRTAWRVRSQYVGSILLWAHRAGAAFVEYQPDRTEPLQYRDAHGNSVASEFAQPPAPLREKIIPSFFLDTLDGHPLLRPIRRAMRRIFQRQAKGTFSVPDDENQIESTWLMIVHPNSASFQRTGHKSFVVR